jgi:hypothetical protein
MVMSDCGIITAYLTDLFEQPEIKTILREYRASGATRNQYVDLMAEYAEPAMARKVRAEFAMLPAVAVTTLIDAWAMADFAGKTLEVASIAPDAPLEFAHSNRVRITIDAEDDRVSVGISHLPNRHAGWYGLAAQSA